MDASHYESLLGVIEPKKIISRGQPSCGSLATSTSAESFQAHRGWALSISRPGEHMVTLGSSKRTFIFIRLDTGIRPRK